MVYIQPMDMIKVRYFVEIAEAGSIAKASEILNISSSALSKSTKALEEQLGVKLLINSGRNIVVTDSGRLLAKQARALLKKMDELEESVVKKAEPKRNIKIATFEVFSTYFLSFLNDAKWDDFALTLYDLAPGDLEKAIAEGHADFGITYLPTPHPDLDLLKVLSIEMGVYTNAQAFKGWPQIELPFVVPIEPLSGNVTRIRGLDGWPDDAYKRNVKFQVTLMESALELVRQGRAAGYFPKFIVQEHNKRFEKKFHLIKRRSPYATRVCTTDVYLIKRISDIEGRLLKQLARGIRQVCG